MSVLHGIPYFEAFFDKKGTALSSAPNMPAGFTDIYVIAHGWNNNNAQARSLYQAFFKSFDDVTKNRPGRAQRKLAILGIFWPSKAFDEVVKQAVDSQGGAVGLGGADEAAADETLERLLDDVEDLFPDDPGSVNAARALIPRLETSGQARDDFVDKLRGLLDRTAANPEDASDVIFARSGDAILTDLATPTPLSAFPNGDFSGGAAGLGDFFRGMKSGAIRFLNYFTYYEMKARAGVVGSKGVAPLLSQAPSRTERFHLIGHSFGGRLVSAAAREDQTAKIHSLALLQAAFSHNGFSESMNGFFRPVVTRAVVHGPILITHTQNDKAVGVAYPIASRLARQNAAALGDANDEYGAIGRNGAQRMKTGETTNAILQAVGSTYAFQSRHFHNLEASLFIKDHGTVTGREVAHAVAEASL